MWYLEYLMAFNSHLSAHVGKLLLRGAAYFKKYKPLQIENSIHSHSCQDFVNLMRRYVHKQLGQLVN